jgi:hypothetical protein
VAEGFTYTIIIWDKGESKGVDLKIYRKLGYFSIAFAEISGELGDIAEGS